MIYAQNVRENGLMVPEDVYVRRWADRLADKLMDNLDVPAK